MIEPYFGGIFAGATRDDDGTEYHLVAAPRAMQFAPAAWGPALSWDNHFNTAGRARRAPHASKWDGLRNTQTAAAVDRDYKIFRHVMTLPYPSDGGSPWYVPAKKELRHVYGALGENEGLTFNYVNAGDNTTREVSWLWSSTEVNDEEAWFLQLRSPYGGKPNSGFKEVGYNLAGVHPVRRILS